MRVLRLTTFLFFLNRFVDFVALVLLQMITLLFLQVVTLPIYLSLWEETDKERLSWENGGERAGEEDGVCARRGDAGYERGDGDRRPDVLRRQ